MSAFQRPPGAAKIQTLCGDIQNVRLELKDLPEQLDNSDLAATFRIMREDLEIFYARVGETFSAEWPS